MGDPTWYVAITREIAVSVEPTYLETRSSPESSQYVWAYRVIIENQGRETVHLLSRHWMITNAPGERFEYTSGAPLDTPWGMMGGAYQIETESGEHFDIEIPTFSLDRPNQSRFVN
jgi:ApaG protein